MKVQVSARLISNPNLELKAGIEEFTNRGEFEAFVIGFTAFPSDEKPAGLYLRADDGSAILVNPKDVSHICVRIIEGSLDA
jgi:hypothetical protein